MIAYYLIVFGTGFLILYAYRAVHLVTANLPKLWKRFFRISFLVAAIAVYASTSYIAVNFETYRENKSLTTYSTVGAITLSVTLLIISIGQLISDIVLFIRYLRTKIGQKRRTILLKPFPEATSSARQHLHLAVWS